MPSFFGPNPPDTEVGSTDATESTIAESATTETDTAGGFYQGSPTQTVTEAFEEDARQAKVAAEAAKVAAEAAKNAAETSEASAVSAAANAASSEAAASSSATSAANSATAASSSESAAASSASSASSSAASAAASETNAAASEAAAAISASSASNSATNAATSASNAAADALTASNQASAATSSAANAASSATAAMGSESSATASAQAALLSELAAASSATSASNSSTSAAGSASNAATSETNASASESAAATSATSAAASASAASASAVSAATQAAAASGSASGAATSANNAAASAASAATSESNAATSEANAAVSEINAAASENAAAASELAAASSASNAATSETNAATSASNAAASASNAATSESNAATSAADAAASFDAFDDRYLGAKSSEPALDNDGNALTVGALFFDTTAGVMKVWSGASWQIAYSLASVALQIANNLSDLADTGAARSNLGLGTSATTDASSYATSAQGALADSAVQPGDNVSTLTNDANYATVSQVDTAVANLVSSAPATLDTLNELASALGNDPNFATTVSNQIGLKLDSATWTASAASGISSTQVSNWDVSYSWGDHSTAGYLTSALAASTYQPILVSGTSIKTVNGQSVLGSGNIQIDGGVTSFNTRTGAVTLSSGDVTTALGYTPLSNATSYLPLSGGTLTGTLTAPSVNSVINSTAAGGSVLIKHSVSETDAWIFQENAPNWGLYWKNAPSGQHTFGGYTSVGAELVGMSATNASGNGVATTNFVGATSAIAQWMISNYTGYIWSASTIYAATSMVVGGNTVLHAGNYGGFFKTINGSSIIGSGDLTVSGTDITKLPLSGGTLTGNLTMNGAGNSTSIIFGDSTKLINVEGYWMMFKGHQNEGFRWQTSDGSSYTTRMQLTSSQLTMNGNVVLHAGNYTSYSPSLTGSGASGTWGISITGNAATATTSSQLGGVSAANYFRVDGTYPNTDMNTPVEGYWHVVNSATGLPEGYYGHRWDYDHLNNGQWVAQFYSPTSGDPGLWFRQRRNYSWQTWRKVLDSTTYSSYALPLSGGTVTGQVSFSKTDNHAIQIGTIRGRAVGSQGGEFVHIYERVHIGSPAGWGSRGAPTFGLSTYGGADLATDTGSVRITTGSLGVADAGTRGLILDGNYTNGQFRHRWRKQDDGNGIPLYLDYAHGSANAFTTIARFGGGGTYRELSIYGTMSCNNGYVSDGNPWGTSNSAFFPNGITTANATNWIYGHCYLGNAPSNGSGAEVQSNGRYNSVVSTGTAMQVRRSGSAGNATNSYTALFEQDYGDHSWGIVGEFRVGASGGTDRPSILFSSGYNSDTWSVGFGYYGDSNFRINRDHGHRNGNWGTTLMVMDRSGNVTFSGNVTAYSDRRLKTDIKRIENAGDIVRRLEGVSFKYREDGRDGIGLIAQDVELVLPQIVGEATSSDGSTHKNVAYGNVVAVLIEAIKDLQLEVADLKARLN